MTARIFLAIFMKKFIFIFAFSVLSVPVFVFGQCGVPGTGLPPCSALGVIDTSINPLIGEGSIDPATRLSKTVTAGVFVTTVLNLVNWFSWFVAVTSVVMGLYSGWLFITSRDNAQQLTAARKTMLYAFIGAAVAIISFSIIAISKAILRI